MKLSALLVATTLFGTQAFAAKNYVYVESNIAQANTLLSYELTKDGKLNPLQEYSTGGKGVVDPSFALGPFDSDQEVITDESHQFVFAVNSGSNSIAVFRIGKNGSLQAVKGSPFASHGINPVSLGVSGDLLTVVNQHGDPAQATDASLPNYTQFRIGCNGELEWQKNSTLEAAKASSPSQALIAPNGKILFGADFLGGTLRSVVNKRGKLTAVSTLAIPESLYPDATTPRFPLGLITHPYAPFLYVGLPTANKIATYSYDWAGNLSLVGATDDSGKVVCWLRANRLGTRLYASNTADPSITVYDIGLNPAKPVEIQKTNLSSQGGSYQLALTANESELVVLTQRYQASVPQGEGNEIQVFGVDRITGKLENSPRSVQKLSLPGDTRPQGVLTLRH